jgi:hypothetical protein
MAERRTERGDGPVLPDSTAKLVARFRKLRAARRRRQQGGRALRQRRGTLSSSQRAEVSAKTGHRCHICGGRVRAGWRADHVLSHSAGGRHEVRNYLPAHAICNGYRWDYSPQECQWIIKIGIWARLRMEQPSALGQEMLEAFHAYETHRAKRAKKAV